MSTKEPTKVGDKWMVDRDPDEKSYYAADITQELLDRNTTTSQDKVEIDFLGVTVLEGPELQTATIGGVEGFYVVVKLGPVDGEPPANWRWTARINCANGERFDKTTWFNRVDT